MEIITPTRTTMNQVCIYWRRGRCNRNPCRFLHRETEQQPQSAPKKRTWRWRNPDNDGGGVSKRSIAQPPKQCNARPKQLNNQTKSEPERVKGARWSCAFSCYRSRQAVFRVQGLYYQGMGPANYAVLADSIRTFKRRNVCPLLEQLFVICFPRQNIEDLVCNSNLFQELIALCGILDAEEKPILLCSFSDCTVRLYDLPSFTERGRIFSKRPVEVIQIGTDGLFFTGDATGDVSVWKLLGSSSATPSS